MEIIRVNRDNQKVDEFEVVDNFTLLDKINELYLAISPDINGLMRMLQPVVYQVILCPDNGAFRCVATFYAEGGQMGIFFPWILPTSKAKHQKLVVAGVIGNVSESDRIDQYQKVFDIFNEETISSRSA